MGKENKDIKVYCKDCFHYYRKSYSELASTIENIGCKKCFGTVEIVEEGNFYAPKRTYTIPTEDNSPSIKNRKNDCKDFIHRDLVGQWPEQPKKKWWDRQWF